MKITISALLFILSYGLQAQQTLSVNQITGDQSVFSGVTYGEKRLKYEDIKGSPYEKVEFEKAKLAENYEELPIRYNSYKDEIEFKKEGNIQVLPKQKEFSRIEIKSPRKTIVFINSNDSFTGYFFELVNGDSKLYKKEKIIFRDAVQAPNSYSSDKPAEFRAQTPIYYILTDKAQFIKNPKSVKDITSEFGSKKDTIENFVKSNKLKVTKEEDLIKIVNFINQN